VKKLRKRATILLIIVIAGSLSMAFNVNRTEATAPPAVQWNQQYPLNQGTSSVTALVQTSDGGYAFVGSNSTCDWLYKTNSAGNELWNKTTYDIIGNDGLMSSSAVALMQTSDGGYALIDSYDYYHANSLYLIKTNTAGNQLWNDSFPGYYVGPTSVVQTSDGGLVWGCTYNNALLPEPNYICLNKTDSSGNLLWGKEYGNGSMLSSFVLTGDGGFAVVGQGSTGALLMKTDSSGNQVWSQTYAGFNKFSCVVQAADGGYALASGNGLIKTDSSGNLQWNQTYGFTIDSIVQTNDGGYALAGGNVLVKTDASGNALWFIDFSESVSCMVRTGDGGYAVAGTAAGSGGRSDFWLAKIAPALPFSDNFANLNAWTVQDGTWTVVSGGVKGTSSFEALMYAGSKSWTDYQVAVPVTISAGGEASIVFRYSDSNDFYWAGMGCW